MVTEFSKQISDLIVTSKEEASRLQSEFVSTEHLMLGLLRNTGYKAYTILESLGVDLAGLRQELVAYIKQMSNPSLPFRSDVSFTNEAATVLKRSLNEAQELNAAIADTEHLLLAILRSDTFSRGLAESKYHITHDTVKSMILKYNKTNTSPNMSLDDNDEDLAMEDERKSQKTASQDNQTTSTPTLDKFCTDLTSLAEKGGLDSVVGRDKEITRVSQILSRRKKNNPVLIGDPGVGKSAIVEGLALRIVEHKVSHTLFDKKILSLDLASVVAGTKYRGQYEERIKNIINELKNNKNIILFIDELHTIVGSGAAAGSMDTANMLKPVLARGEFQCIGATTNEEYRKVIEKDGALDRRFQKVTVEEPDAEETLQILRNIKDKYEEYHNVTYTDAALEACVKLSKRYIAGRAFPDKAIDVLDEAGARAHAVMVPVPEEITCLERKLSEIKAEKNNAIRQQNFEQAANLRDSERTMQTDLLQAKSEWEKHLKDEKQVIDTDSIEKIVSDMTGVPLQRLAKSERQRLANMATELKAKVIGQDTAIDTICKSIIRNRVGINSANKPIGVFLFLGPTGVGKTYLVKQLAEFMFGDSNALIRIDMSEYTEKYNVSRLVGAPPGYVGYEEGGQLTERVRKKPYSIILLDEIEKAHAEVYNLLLQIMDEGRLTDSYGRTVDFKNTIIIMTSNIGSRQLKDFPQRIGFTGNAEGYEGYSKDVMTKSLNKTFSPEFINRLDEIVSFNPLSKEMLRKIVELELGNLTQRLKALGHTLHTSAAVEDFIIEKGYKPEFGARPLKRTIQDYIEDEISMKLLDTDDKSFDIDVDTNTDKKGLVIELHPQNKE